MESPTWFFDANKIPLLNEPTIERTLESKPKEFLKLLIDRGVTIGKRYRVNKAIAWPRREAF